MKFPKIWPSGLLLCVALAVPASEYAQTIAFSGNVYVGSTIAVTGVANETVSIYSFAAKPTTTCDLSIAGVAPLPITTVPPGAPYTLAGASGTIPLTAPLVAGTYLCLKATYPLTDSSGATTIYNVVSALPVQVQAPVGVSIQGKLTAGDTTISVVSDAAADVEVFAFPSTYALVPPAVLCARGDITSALASPLAINASGSPVDSQRLVGAKPETIQLVKPLEPGAQLCLFASYTAAVPPAPLSVYSPLATVAQAPAPTLKFASELVTGTSTFTIQSDTAGSVSVYLFGAGYRHKSDPDRCTDDDREKGTPLTINTSGAAAPTASIVSILPTTVNTPVTVALSNPLAAGTQICLFESPTAGGANTEFSIFKRVAYYAPGNDFGRFVVDLTGGAMISNEQQVSNSATASEYFDLGLSYTLARPGSRQISESRKLKMKSKGLEPTPNWFEEHGPGVSTLMDIKLTTIPVAATTSPTPTTPATPTLTQSLNVLSSQQSATVLMGIYFPVRLTHWYKGTNWITAAPLAVGGFDTLLNPTTTTATPGTAGPAATVTTSNFSSVYNFHAAGARFGWDIYPKRTDEAPLEFSWFSLTLGWYSNLPSWKCTPTSNSHSPTFTSIPTTSCNYSSMPNSASPPVTIYTVYESRKLVPRVNVAGELKLPSYPIVFGYDANLGQYASWFEGKGIDSLNKPGNDVRFYFGLKVDIKTALTKFGFPSS